MHQVLVYMMIYVAKYPACTRCLVSIFYEQLRIIQASTQHMQSRLSLRSYRRATLQQYVQILNTRYSYE